MSIKCIQNVYKMSTKCLQNQQNQQNQKMNKKPINTFWSG